MVILRLFSAVSPPPSFSAAASSSARPRLPPPRHPLTACITPPTALDTLATAPLSLLCCSPSFPPSSAAPIKGTVVGIDCGGSGVAYSFSMINH